jgi:hypothetical protein
LQTTDRRAEVIKTAYYETRRRRLQPRSIWPTEVSSKEKPITDLEFGPPPPLVMAAGSTTCATGTVGPTTNSEAIWQRRVDAGNDWPKLLMKRETTFEFVW